MAGRQIPGDGVVVDVPDDADASAVGRMQLLSWQQTYPSAEHGIDAAWIIEHVGFRTSPAADDFRRRLYAAQREEPEGTFYRVARNDRGVIAFVHASRAAPAASAEMESRDTAAGGQGSSDHRQVDATLEALYLLREHQGTGLADHLMAVLLDWLGDQAMRLEVASYNARAIRFYERHGFHLTGETALFRQQLPIVTMRRAEQRH